MDGSFARLEGLNMPKLSWAAFAGDLPAVRRCLAEGADINEGVTLKNHNKEVVTGVTALYLAAQSGHTDVVRELLRAGADVNIACAIPATGQVFGPTDIALVHFNLRTWWVLKDARDRRGGARKGGRGFDAHSLMAPLINDGVAMAI